jgi:hypothetical protein
MVGLTDSRISRMRRAGPVSLYPHGDVIRCEWRMATAGPNRGKPHFSDVSRLMRNQTVDNTATTRPYRSSNASPGTTVQDANDAWVGYIASSTGYYELDYDARNAITSGDFHIGCRVWLDLSTNTYYIWGVQGTTPNGADTAWNIVIGGGGNRCIGLVTSDGSSRVYNFSPTDDIVGAAYRWLAAERVGSTIYLYVDGVRKHSYSYSSTLNIPSSTKLRIGHTTGGFGTALGPRFFDWCQVKRRSLFNGAASVPNTRYPMAF